LAQPGPAESGVAPFAPGVVEKAVRALCSTVDRLVQRRTFATALSVTADQELAKAFAGDVAMAEEEKQQIAALSETVCLQYAILGQHAPVVFLAVTAAGYGTKVYLVLNKLESLAKFNKLHQEKAKPAPKPDAADVPKTGTA
jgi:hypothetical protein